MILHSTQLSGFVKGTTVVSWCSQVTNIFFVTNCKQNKTMHKMITVLKLVKLLIYSSILDDFKY